MSLQKQINKLDALIATKPQVLQAYKDAKLIGNKSMMEICKNQLVQIQEAPAEKVKLLNEFEQRIQHAGARMEFGGFTITETF